MTEATGPAATGRRRAGRSTGVARAAPSTAQYRALKHRFAPTPVVSEDELEAIHDASLTILEEMGMDFMHPQAREILKKAGADVVDGSDRVRFDRNLILQSIKTCPSEFTLHARNPQRNVQIGGKNLVFAQVASPPNCSDMQRGRRAGNQIDFRNMVRLAQRYDMPAAAIRSSRSTSTPRCDTSIACRTSPNSPTSRFTCIRWARSAIRTGWRLHA